MHPWFLSRLIILLFLFLFPCESIPGNFLPSVFITFPKLQFSFSSFPSHLCPPPVSLDVWLAENYECCPWLSPELIDGGGRNWHPCCALFCLTHQFFKVSILLLLSRTTVRHRINGKVTLGPHAERGQESPFHFTVPIGQRKFFPPSSAYWGVGVPPTQLCPVDVRVSPTQLCPVECKSFSLLSLSTRMWEVLPLNSAHLALGVVLLNSAIGL